MKCPKCGVETPDASQFCHACGAKIDPNLKCTKCGVDIPKDSQFCNACGTKVASPIDQSKDVAHSEPIKPVQSTSVKENTAKKSILSPRNIVLAIGGIIVILVILAILAAFVGGFTAGILATPPTANFYASTTSGSAPLQVSFTDQSSNNPTSLSWNFGDGSTSNEPDPTHIYDSTGTYQVTLTASNGGGSSTATVTIDVLPSVTLTAINLNVEYTSTSGYFGPTSQVISDQDFKTGGGSTFTDTITLTSSALLFSHTVNSFSITTPGFSLVSVTPNVPSGSISPGSSEAFTLTIQSPNNEYYGPLNILVTTS
jgi:PKD repeat protein